MIAKLLCWLVFHNWAPTSYFTCNSNDTGHVCRRCQKEEA